MNTRHVKFDAAGQILLSRERSLLMQQHAEECYPEEACGGLLGRVEDGGVQVVRVVPLSNQRKAERHRRYLIGPDDVLDLERRAAEANLQVLGYYHSHPDAPAEPSRFDHAHAWPWYIYVIVGVRDGEAQDARAFRLSNDRQQFDPVKIEGSGR